MRIVRVAAAIVGKTGVTLYMEDGSTELLRSDAFETSKILDAVMPFAVKHQIAVIDLDAYSAHREIEKKTGGLLRFFKAVGEKAAAIFDRQGVNKGVDNGFQVARPTETTVAVINGVEVPGMEQLAKQIDYAATTGNVEGLKRFMERIAAVVDKRGHTVQELLRFMEKGDLPIADDGTIIAYKMLYSTQEPGVYVDPHSRTVRQRVGSVVQMPESEVDASRRTQCSTGLHIARRNYLRGFNGDTIMLVKIDPADVIAVPAGEPDKMRVARYHVIAKVNDTAYGLLRDNRPMTGDPESAKLLANAIKGTHIGQTEVVSITGKGAPKEKKIETAKVENAKPAPLLLDNAVAITVDEAIPESVKPMNVQRRAEEMRAEAAESAALVVAPEPVKQPKPKKAKTVKASKPKSNGLKVLVESAKPTTPAVKIDATDTEKRDAQVLELIKAGKGQREIERLTGVSARTVRRILDKNGMRGDRKDQ